MDELERKIFAGISRYEYERKGYIETAQKFSVVKPDSDQVKELEAQAKLMVTAFQELINLVVIKRED